MKYIFIILLFISCGTRKIEQTKRDSIIIENSYSQGSKIVLANTFTYIPIDTLKPMIIEGKQYVNVKISNDKSKIITKWKDRVVTKKEMIYKTKIIEKKDSANLWIGIILVIVIGIIIWFKA